MATMERIRQMSPYLLAAFAILFVLFMVISDMDLGTVVSTIRRNEPIGEVNGVEIFYQEFERRVQEQVDRQRQQQGEQAEINYDAIREAVWNQMVEEILLQQVAEEMGIEITDDEIRDIMLDNPPEYLRRIATDSVGNFNRQLYVQIMTDPEGFLRQRNVAPQQIQEFLNYLLEVEDFLRKTKLKERIQSVVTASYALASPTFLKTKYFVDQASAVARFVAFPINTVSDDEVTVSEQEMRAYYNRYKSTFTQRPMRKLKYVTFPLVPSDLDTQRARRKIQRITNALQQAKTLKAQDSIFSVFMAEYGGTKHDYTNVSSIPPDRLEILRPLKVGEVRGPVELYDGTYFFRLDGRRQGTDTVVRARHILIKAGPSQQSKDSARKVALELLRRIRKGEDFAALAMQYSKDPGSAPRGGDLGYFGRGRMVPEFEEAAFKAKVGQVVGPIETQFGFHLIKVEDKVWEEIAYSEIRIVPTVSPATRNAIMRKAYTLRQWVEEEGIPFDTAAKRLGVTPSETGFFPQTTPIFGSRTLTSFAFNENLGAVSPPVEVQNMGIVVAQIIGIRTKGIRPFEDVKEEIRRRLVHQKKLNVVGKKAQEVYQKLQGIPELTQEAVSAIDPQLVVHEAGSIHDNGSVPNIGQDFGFTAAVFQVPINKIAGPIRGENGYYILQVLSRALPDTTKFPLNSYLEQERKRLKTTIFYEWFTKLKNNADIRDYRYRFYQ